MQDQEMNSLYRYKPTTLLALVVVLAICVTSCGAGRQPYTRGTQAALDKDYEAAMIEFKRAIDRQPCNTLRPDAGLWTNRIMRQRRKSLPGYSRSIQLIPWLKSN